MAAKLVYVLLSGGIDSTAVLARAIALKADSGDGVRAVTINYGQRHIRELFSAALISAHLAITQEEMYLPIASRTMLTDPEVPVPETSYAEIEGVSPTYVPFRNGMMLSRLTSLIAERHLDPLAPAPFAGPIEIHWGAHAEDAAGDAYPDCSVEFIGAMACAIHIGTYRRVRLITPFANETKASVIAQGTRYGALFALTWSCYKGETLHCGKCATCQARRQAFVLAGIPDPTEYAG